MAQNLKDAVALRNARLDALTTFVGTSAKLRMYSGTQPANVATAVTGSLLVECICNATAFAAAATGGVLTANSISNGTGQAAAGAGTAAGYFRMFKADGTTACFDGTVGTGGAGTFDLLLDNVSIAQSQVVAITSLTRTAGNA